MIRVVIETIEHKEQRYPTCGDWQYVDGELRIKVSKLNDSRFEFLIAIHEAIEAYMSGPEKEKVLDEFDMTYEQNRKDGDTLEPGDDPSCPVYGEHQIATAIERTLAAFMGVHWPTYEAAVERLYEEE